MNEENEIVCCDHICLVYKCVVKEFLNKKSEFVFQTRMIPQKRLSCKKCEWNENLVYKYREDKDFLRTNHHDLVHGKYYSLVVSSIKNEDDFDIEFIEYKKPKSEGE